MANVVDTKLYDILGVSPSASENELKKVFIQESQWKLWNYIMCLFQLSLSQFYSQEMRCYAQLANVSPEKG